MKHISHKLVGDKGKGEEEDADYDSHVELEWELSAKGHAKLGGAESSPAAAFTSSRSPRLARKRRNRSATIKDEELVPMARSSKSGKFHDLRLRGMPEMVEDPQSLVVLNKPRFSSKDVYVWLVNLPWLLFAVLFISLYMFVALVWATIYLIEPNCIINGGTRVYARLLWFSIQTQTTIGYGYMSPDPVCIWTNIAVALQSISAILIVALWTGIVFRKFAAPSSRFQFSEQVLLTEANDSMWLTFRLANKRVTGTYGNKCTLIVISERPKRVVHSLPLSRQSVPFFQLGWNLFHEITQESPLYGLTAKDYKERRLTFFATFRGHDPLQNSTIWARAVWPWNKVVWGGRFAEMCSRGVNGERVFDFEQISRVVKDGEHVDTQVTII